MATRKSPRKQPAPASRLVPALRDAVEVVDRALKELGQPPPAAKKRTARRPPKK